MHSPKHFEHTNKVKSLNPEASLRQRKVEQTLARVVQVAWQMFETEGYDQVSMEAIGNAADLAKATLYKYFPCKEAILEQHFKAEMRARKEEVQKQLFTLKSYQEKIAYLFQLEANYLQDKQRYLAPLLRYRMQKWRMQSQRKILRSKENRERRILDTHPIKLACWGCSFSSCRKRNTKRRFLKPSMQKR